MSVANVASASVASASVASASVTPGWIELLHVDDEGLTDHMVILDGVSEELLRMAANIAASLPIKFIYMF